MVVIVIHECLYKWIVVETMCPSAGYNPEKHRVGNARFLALRNHFSCRLVSQSLPPGGGEVFKFGARVFSLPARVGLKPTYYIIQFRKPIINLFLLLTKQFFRFV